MQKEKIRNIAAAVLVTQIVIALIAVYVVFVKAAKETETGDVTATSDVSTEQLAEAVATATNTATPTATSTPTATPTSTPTPIFTLTPMPASDLEHSENAEFDTNLLSAPMPKPTATPTPVYTPARTLASSSLSVQPSGRYTVYGLLTDQEMRDMAALVYLEAGAQSYKCQQAIASVIVNLMVKNHASVNSTIFNTRTFSPARSISRTNPSQSCINAVRDVLENGCTLPSNVTAFRNRHYHNFGTPYCVIDGVYFSTN